MQLIGINRLTLRGDIKYYFADFVHKGVPPTPLRTKFSAKKCCFLPKNTFFLVKKVTDLGGTPLYGQEEGVTDLGGTPHPLTPLYEQIHKVVFDVLPYFAPYDGHLLQESRHTQEYVYSALQPAWKIR